MDEVVAPPIEEFFEFDKVEPEKALRLRRRVDRIVRTARQVSPHPTLAIVRQLDPLVVNPGRVTDLIRLAGGQPIPEGSSSWEDLRRADPSILLIAPIGLSVEQTQAQIDRLPQRPGDLQLASAIDRRVYVLDGDLLGPNTGPQLVEGLEMLAQILHPRVFPGLVHLDETKLRRL